MLVEIAREEAGHVPEVSYGTHFFQDLVEAQIIYLPVYPDDPPAGFNAGFFDGLPNVLLAQLLPDAGKFTRRAPPLRSARSDRGKQYARACRRSASRRAVCFLGRQRGFQLAFPF